MAALKNIEIDVTATVGIIRPGDKLIIATGALVVYRS